MGKIHGNQWSDGFGGEIIFCPSLGFDMEMLWCFFSFYMKNAELMEPR